MKGVIYARYSTHHQTERSIEGQVDDCMKYAEDNNIEIIDTYVDRAQSGTNDNRQAFRKMLHDSHKQAFESVVVWKLDRFGRNREETAINKVKLRKNGVSVFYAKEHIPDGPEGIILESVLEGMAEYYSANLSQNVKRGMLQNAKKAKPNGGATPFGFLVEDGEYKIHDVNGPIVKEMFELYDSGESFASIVEFLNSRNIKTSRGKPFGSGSVRPILENEKYIGVYRFDSIRTEDAIPRIVTDELFYRVQKNLTTARLGRKVRKNKLAYQLTGKIFCSKCGKPYIADAGTSQTGKVYNYYVCAGKKKHSGCKNTTYWKTELEDFVIKSTRDNIFKEGVIDMIADKIIAIQKKNQESVYKTEMKRQMIDVEKGIKNILDAIEAGVFTSSTKDRLIELEAEKEKLHEAIIEENYKAIPLTKDAIVWWLSKYKNNDADEEIIRSFINAVYVNEDQITVFYNYSQNNSTYTSEQFENLSSSDYEMVIPINRTLNLLKGDEIFFTSFYYQKIA